jgi:hypothetical protein
MTDPILLLREADPAGDPTAAEIARMDAALARVLDEPAVAPRRRRLAPRLALVLVAAAGIAVAVAAVPDRAPHRLAPAPATAATVLAELGRKAGAEPAQEGRYAYLKQLSYTSHMRPRKGAKGSYVVVLPTEVEEWVENDGSGVIRIITHEEQATFPTERDRADYEHAGGPQAPWDSRPFRLVDVQVGGLTAEQVLALPTDPALLRARLEQGKLDVTSAAAQLLGSPLTPQPVKAALFAVLRGLPGAELVGDETDPQGRTGVGVQFDSSAWKTLFLFDPDSGALLATRSIGKKELPGRTISDWNLVLGAERRNSAPAPTAPQPQRIER